MRNEFRKRSRHNRKYDKALHIRKNKSTYMSSVLVKAKKMIDMFKIFSLFLD